MPVSYAGFTLNLNIYEAWKTQYHAVFDTLGVKVVDNMKALVYFQNDLRVHDNDALHHALKNHDQVIALVNVRSLNKKTANGFPKLGLPRRQFLYETLQCLKASLAALNVPLIVKSGDPFEVVTLITERYNVGGIYTNKAVGSEEDMVLSALKRTGGLKREPRITNSLIAPDDLPFPIDAMPEVFTSFRKRVEPTLRIRQPLTIPKKAAQPVHLHPEDAAWPDFALDQSFRSRFKGGETEGLKRLEYYTFGQDLVRTYKKTRNGMLRDDDSTKLSPYLAVGSLSPRTVYERVRAYEKARTKNDSTYWVIFELLWRDFFTFMHLKHGNRFFHAYGMRGRHVPWSSDQTLFNAWKNGETGYPLVDAAMNELRTTGFMSNRARQNVASFLTKNLGIDWRMGAEWFESLLIDHDVSSNYGNWQYVAGIGNDQREFRFFNVMTQGKRYDPSGTFAKHYIPALRGVNGSLVYELPAMDDAFARMLAPDYREPIVDFHASIENRKQALKDFNQE